MKIMIYEQYSFPKDDRYLSDLNFDHEILINL